MNPSNYSLINQLLGNIHITTANKVDDVPAGAPAIVMIILLPKISKPLYVKVEVGVSCKAIGRSFHLSYK